MNELFRFMVVKPPKQTTKNIQERVLHLFNRLPENRIQHFEGYHTIHGKDMVNHVANNFYNSNQFIKDWANLQEKLGTILNSIKALQEPINNDQILQIINAQINGNPTSFFSGGNYERVKVQVIESLIVALILGEKTANVKDSLVQLFKMLSAIETIAISGGETEYQELMKRVVILPKEIFPKPTNDAYLAKKRAVREATQKAVEEKKAAVAKLKEEIADKKEAIEELIFLYRDHIKENPEKDTEPSSSGVIPRKFGISHRVFDKLKQTHQSFIKKAAGKAEHLSLPEVIEKMERGVRSGIDRLSELEMAPPTDDPLAAPPNVYVPSIMGDCAGLVSPEVEPFPTFPITPPAEFKLFDGQLFKVRQELVRYEKGEIAHIENVLKGEKKLNKHRRFNQTDESTIDESETTEETEKDLQTHDQYELQTETNRTITNDKAADAGITISASYGPVETTADANTSTASSSQSDNRTTSNYARDITTRSVQKIKERVFKKRSTRKIEEYEIINEHSIDNSASDAEHVRGIYHWVNKIYKVQVVNYGNRKMLEFVIPEPAAFYRFAMTFQPQEGKQFKKPPTPGYCRNGVFTALKVTDIEESSYLNWVSMYNVEGVEPPPQLYQTVFQNKTFQKGESGDNPAVVTDGEGGLTIPNGYVVLRGYYKLVWGRGSEAAVNGANGGEIAMNVLVGLKEILSLRDTSYSESKDWSITGEILETDKEIIEIPINELSGTAAGYVNSDSISNQNNKIPISISGFANISFSLNIGVSIICERSEKLYQQWQLDTFHKIMNAYNEQLSQYHRELEVMAFNASIEIQGRNPFINREVEKIELKKLCIAQLTGQHFESFHSVQDGITSVDFPEIDLEASLEEGKIVRFFENAFEWHNMTYLFYPYYWTNRNHWVKLMQIKDKDSLFERFLQAGSARVQVPVRFDFEIPVEYYLKTANPELIIDNDPQTAIWDKLFHEGDNTQSFLSMLDDMLSQRGVDFNRDTVGTISVQAGSRQVVGNETVFDATADTDREIIIATKSYRIAAVESATSITLREAYVGESVEGIGYYLGPKFDGEAWEELVPTELVYLSENQNI